MQMLNDGVKGIALDRAMSEANDHVYQIRNSELKEEEKIQGLRNLAQDFTLRLTGMGMDPQQIKQAQLGIAPDLQELNSPEMTALKGRALGVPEMAERAEAMIEKANKAKIDAAKIKIENKDQEKYDKFLLDTSKQFASQFVKNQSASKAISNALKLLRSNSKMKADAVATAFVKGSGDVGNIRQEERAAYYGAQDVHSKIMRKLEQLGSSEIPDTDKQELLKLGEIYQSTFDEATQDHAILLTNQLSSQRLFENDDPGQLLGKISGRRFNATHYENWKKRQSASTSSTPPGDDTPPKDGPPKRKSYLIKPVKPK